MALLGCNKQPKDNSLVQYQNAMAVSDFAPELWLKDNTYKGSFSDDYKTFYFFRKKSPDQEKYIPYQSSYKNGKWGKAKIPGYYHSNSSYTYQLKVPKSRQLVFLSNKRYQSDTSQVSNYNFWMIDSADTAPLPKEMGYTNLINNYNSQPCITRDGTIYFTSDAPDWSATYSYEMKRNQAAYSQPELFELVNRWRGDHPNWTVYEFCMAPTKEYMIVCIKDKGAPNPSVDLYVSYLNNSQWSTPEKLGEEINTGASENFPVITQDGKFLLFTRAFSEFKIVTVTNLLKS